LAAELEQQLDVSTELIASGGGVFEITADGKRVFSKKELGRFPDEGEIVRLLRAKAG
jgi:selenoprotein W-related protein